MKRTTSLLSNLLLSSTLFWGLPTLAADELIIKEAASLSFHCHTQFPDIRAEDLSWDRRALNETAGNLSEYYGPCDHDLNGADEIRTQRQLNLENRGR